MKNLEMSLDQSIGRESKVVMVVMVASMVHSMMEL